jgi:C_GCAxxG_C_C family probable redox protein
MSQTEEKAIALFTSGLNCAQAVTTAYSEKLNFDNTLALNISCGFGGGMGRLQETCGAVTGAYMVLSIFNGQKYTENGVKKIMTYSMIQEFNSKFSVRHKTTNCMALLNCDLTTEEGLNYLHENNLHEKVCKNCIRSAIQIINALID